MRFPSLAVLAFGSLVSAGALAQPTDALPPVEEKPEPPAAPEAPPAEAEPAPAPAAPAPAAAAPAPVAPAMAIAVRPPDAETLASLAQEGPDASLGEPLGRDIASRAVVTTAGAGAAWPVARIMGSRERASTVGLLALVGTQLGQTLMSGGFSRPVVMTSALSAAALGLTVQTPGLSHFFGCRPLGPVGWATAIGASTLATAASVAYPEVVTRVARRLKLAKVIPAQDPAQLAAKG